MTVLAEIVIMETNGPGVEWVLLVVGGVLTLALLAAFFLLLRVIRREERAAAQKGPRSRGPGAPAGD